MGEKHEEKDILELKRDYINRINLYNGIVEEPKRISEKTMPDTKSELVRDLYKIALSKDKSAEAKFIDDAVEFWHKEYKPELIKIMKKINKNWKEK